MKCSEYLWTRIQLDTAMPKDASPERVQGEMRLAMEQNGDTVIVSDTTGAVLTEQEANSIYGRNYDRLNEAYKLGRKSLFELICTKQQISDDEWEAAKKAAEESAPQDGADTPEEGEEG